MKVSSSQENSKGLEFLLSHKEIRKFYNMKVFLRMVSLKVKGNYNIGMVTIIKVSFGEAKNMEKAHTITKMETYTMENSN